MNIAIIDADLVHNNKHRFPNLVCMKLSAYYKELGNDVILKLDYNDLDIYDKVYIAKVFTQSEVPNDVLKKDNVIYGGTGFFYDKATPLPNEIEHHIPDYHLYDDYVNECLLSGEPRTKLKYYLDYSIGYTTRGCFRKCPFCVNKNYNKVIKHSPIKEFYDSTRKKICLLDDNILGYSGWKEIFEELQSLNIPFQYKQGLDERMLTDDKCKYLANSRYDDKYIFAFDNIADKDTIIEKSKLLRKYIKKKQKIKFYVLCGYDRDNKYTEEFWLQDIIDTFDRIYTLAKFGFMSYIMRYEKYKESPYYGTYVCLARYCNQPNVFWKLSYKEFVINDGRYSKCKNYSSLRYYNQICDKLDIDFNIIPNNINEYA